MTFEKRPLAPMVYQIFIVVLVLISGLLWMSYSDSNKTVQTQKNIILNLQTNLNTTTIENSGLKNQITTLQNEKITLQNEIYTLNSQTSQIQSEVNKLKANITVLGDQAKELNEQLTEKNREITDLNTTKNNLLQQVNSLNTQIATLQSKISNQTAIINLSKTKILADDANVTVLATTTEYLQYDTDFAGYLGITFTSTTEVKVEFGNSEIQYTWYGTYPQTGTTQLASIKIPIIPGTTYIKIINSSPTEDALIFYYITYYY